MLLFTGSLLLLGGCHDEWDTWDDPYQHIEEGIPGELSIPLCAAVQEDLQVSTRAEKDPIHEQHVHSAYLFIIDRPKNSEPKNCRILSRKYFADISSFVQKITYKGETRYIAQLTMPAVTSKQAQIFAIANLGYSDLQSVENDATLLQQCDTLTSLQSLMQLSASLSILPEQTVNVERMQGHHLMSGFYCTEEQNKAISSASPLVTLKAETGNRISICAPGTTTPYLPLNDTQQAGTAAAVFLHRLDAKITVRIVPAGELQQTPGAYFRLIGWEVLNTPVHENLYRINQPAAVKDQKYLNSKLFQRDLNQGEDGSWEFTFYQFENKATPLLKPEQELTAQLIADQYNKEYGLAGTNAVSARQITSAFSAYPNQYSDFAYTLRDLNKKYKGAEGQNGAYDPKDPTNDNQIIVVKNGDFEYAPQHATYIRVAGTYYNPQEPVKRQKNDPVSLRKESLYPISTYPYWGKGGTPVKTAAEAVKRTRSATVVYYVHLGYVGGTNYSETATGIPNTCRTFDDFQKKVNDYNICRNHHYIYTLKVAGVENIRLEATREEAGNILEQEKQTGAEGAVLESQHMFQLDAHYEARNFTIDFSRMPDTYSEGFAFAWETPFDRARCILKKAAEENRNCSTSMANPC
ncbi:hypothetical protein EVA_01583 [gut metagenome]|uniref:Uncharacterized protein n=1 Tax=gut metagenome TaxID=749906 RepID=J9GQZ9_9ZZZZ